jgi:hypothetical protein
MSEHEPDAPVVRPPVEARRHWQAADVTAVCSMFVSVLAFAFGVVVERRSERHDRLSMQPILQVKERFDDDGAGLVMTNKGAGPAYIRGYRLFVDGMSGEQSPNYLPVPGASEKFYGIALNPQDYVLSPSDDFRLFWYAENRIDPITTNVRRESDDSFAFRQTMTTMRVDLCFCSIYEECWHQFWTFPPESVQSCEPYRSSKTAVPLR